MSPRAVVIDRALALLGLVLFVGPIVLWSCLLPESWGAWMWLPVLATWALSVWVARWVWRRVRRPAHLPLPEDYLL